MTSLGHYDLERKLGEGAFGSVFKATHHDRPDHAVALKIVDSRGGDVNRLLAEPALLAQVKHPCVVGVEDYFVADGKLGIALEFINGEDLKAILDRGDEFTPEQVRTLLIQLAGALSAAHAQQIVHRDIKPANILVDRTGGVRFVLTDFGIGRRHEGLQGEKHAGGTYHFMAPEQLRGRPGPQSDLWALGVVAYRLLAGRLPFPGPTFPELARQIQYESPAPPSEACGRPLPSDLEAAVMKLLDKSLTERTHSAGQLLKDLGYHGDSTKVTQAPARSGNSQSQEPLHRQIARTIRRNRMLMLACILVYVLPTGVLAGSLLIAGIVLFFLSQSVGRSLRFWPRMGVTFAALTTMLLSRYWSARGWPDLGLGGIAGLMSLGTRVSAAAMQANVLVMMFVALWPFVVFAYLAFLPVIGSACYANLRRAQREQTLWDAALSGRLDSDAFLATMRAMIDVRIEDVGFHLRYAELLFARGNHREAAIEARLLLVQDPYHFNGNMLLANAYAALGLWGDCLVVCDDYLQVAGYCFEFAELKQQCLERQVRA